MDEAALLDHTATTGLVWHLANAPINSKNFSSFVHAVIRAEKIPLAEQGTSASAIEDFISSVNDLRILRFVLDGQHDRWRCLQCGVASHEELTGVYIAASKQLVRLPTARATANISPLLQLQLLPKITKEGLQCACGLRKATIYHSHCNFCFRGQSHTFYSDCDALTDSD